MTTGAGLLALLLMIATVFFGLLGSEEPLVVDLLFFILPLSFTVVGVVLGRHRPENRIGWLCLAIGLLWSVEGAVYSVADWAAGSGNLEVAEWVGLLSAGWLPAVVIMGTHLPLRLPDGSLLSPRWRWWSRLSTAALLVAGVVVVTAPGPVAEVAGTSNPLGSTALESLSPVFLVLAAAVAGAIWSMVLRYRRARGVERMQIRWIAFAGGLAVIAVITAFVPDQLGLVAENSAPAIVEAFTYLAFSALPIAICISVLRYRLYDIDVVINRTLVYGSLTATLAAAYLGSVLLLQLALRGVTQDSGLAVAGSTLAVAALFRPLRERIQGAVDRRFYRARYDARRTLESFTARLRDQVDLVALDSDLRDVVTETVQPAHVSLWLRERRS